MLLTFTVVFIENYLIQLLSLQMRDTFSQKIHLTYVSMSVFIYFLPALYEPTVKQMQFIVSFVCLISHFNRHPVISLTSDTSVAIHYYYPSNSNKVFACNTENATEQHRPPARLVLKLIYTRLQRKESSPS